MKKNWFDPINYKATQTQVKTFMCPSCPDDKNRPALDNKNLNAAISDYTVPGGLTGNFMDFCKNNGIGVPQNTSRSAVLNGQGIGTSITEITDGTSNSLLVYESGGRPKHYISGKVIGEADSAFNCDNNKVKNGITVGAAWADPGGGSPVHGFNKNGTICSEACVINCTNNQEAYSFHTGGMNASFADGSVRYINENINIVTFCALVTMAGGEVIPDY